MSHKSVLLNEIIENLNIKDNDIYLDLTLGNGGHALAVYQSAKKVKVIGVDADDTAIQKAKDNFEKADAEIITYQGYFDSLDKALQENGFNKVDKVLIDLGLRSDQLDNSERGFSFQQDGPLKMTFSLNPEKDQATAYEVVNDWSEESLADIIYGFGEERYSRRIAKKIVDSRNEKPIETTFELRDIVLKAMPFVKKYQKTHPATKTFQAIRIAVNNELSRIQVALEKAFTALNSGGRMAVISFHSLEDRIVKNFFKEKSHLKELILINKKPLTPQKEESTENPRSRSAKLRIIEKI